MGYLDVANDTLANGIFFGIQPFTSLSITAVTSSDSLYISSYLLDEDIDTTWRSTSTALQNIDLNMGSAIVNPVVIIKNTNFKNATLYLDDETSFTAPPVTSAIEIFKDIRTKVRGGWFALTGTYQHLRFRITGSQTTDGGEGYYYVGDIIVIPAASLIIPGARHQFPLSVERFRPHLEVEYVGGAGRAAVNFGRRRCRFNLTNVGFHIDDEEKIWSIADMDNNQNFLFFENLKAPTVETRATDTSRVYLVKQIGDYEVTEITHLIETGWILEEQ